MSVPEASAQARGSRHQVDGGHRRFHTCTVAQAFHWFATGSVVAEIHRELRPGAALAAVRNRRDCTRLGWAPATGAGYVRPVPSPRQVPPWARRMAAVAIDTTWTWVCDLGAIGPDHPRARRFGAFGDGSLIAFPPGAIFNEHWIHIGSRTMIGPHVSLSAGMAPGQEMVSDPVVSIGDRTLIGRGSHIVGHFCIEIGDDIQTGPYVYITDQNHVYSDPDVPIGAQWPVESSVRIGSGSWLGTGVVVLPGSTIGRNVAVGAGSVVTGDLPDHCVAVGSPAKVVKRYSPGEGWRAVDQKLAGSRGLTAPKKKKIATSEAAPPTP